MAQEKVYTLEDLKVHVTDKSCWLAVNGKVYDVTEFLEEHPGGYDIIVSSTGKDATKDFEEIGHSKSAKQLLEKYLIGTFEGGVPVKEVPPAAVARELNAKKPVSTATRTFNVFLPVALLAAALAINWYLSSKQSSQ